MCVYVGGGGGERRGGWVRWTVLFGSVCSALEQAELCGGLIFIS